MVRSTRELLEVRVWITGGEGRHTAAAVWLTGLDTLYYTPYMDR